MLYLDRRIGESVCIGDDIMVMVARVERGELVKLAIAAPPAVPIWREELWYDGRPRPAVKEMSRVEI